MDEDEVKAIVSNPEEKGEKEKRPRDYQFALIKGALSSQDLASSSEAQVKKPKLSSASQSTNSVSKS